MHPQGVRVEPVGTGRGDGVVASRSFTAGSIVLREAPCIGRQTPPNRRCVLACGHMRCLAPLAAPEAQLSLLCGEYSRVSMAACQDNGAPDPAVSGLCWCPDGCGECYCSPQCRSAAAGTHRLLCVGPIPDDEPDHPLLRFKLHGLRCNEAFLLAGDVVASLLADAADQAGGDEHVTAATVRDKCGRWLRHFQPGGGRLWWDVALQPPMMAAAGVTEQVFRDSCKAHVRTSATLLQASLAACAPQLAAVATPALEVDGFYGHLLGLFELYSMGVRIDSPVVPWCRDVVASGTEAARKQAAELINASLDAEDGDLCCDSSENESAEDGSREANLGEKSQQSAKRHKPDPNVPNGQQEQAPRQQVMGTEPEKRATEEREDVESEEELSVEQCDDFLKQVALGALCDFPAFDGTALYSTVCKLNH
eukprot:COSAG05_NODE_2451_length_3047_cov_5.200136_2_plen_421_part_01